MNKSQLENIIREFLNYIKVDAELDIEQVEEKFYTIRLDGDDLSFLIGYHGKTLDAFQHLVNLFLYKQAADETHINLDINGYKDNRKEKLQEITKKYIDKVRFFDKEIHMSPMSAWERKQVHLFIGEYPDIEDESMGEGEERHIVLKKRK
jgi:spoIIIJ-associated protein